MKNLYKEGTIFDNELILGIDSKSVVRVKFFVDGDGIEALTRPSYQYFNYVKYYVIKENLFGKAALDTDIRCLGQLDLETLHYVRGLDIDKFNVFLLKLKMLYPQLNIMTREEFQKEFDEFYNQNRFVMLRKSVKEHPIMAEIGSSYVQHNPADMLFAEVKGKYYNIWYMCKDKRVYDLGIVRNLDKIDFTKFTIGLSYLHASERDKYILLGEVR